MQCQTHKGSITQVKKKKTTLDYLHHCSIQNVQYTLTWCIISLLIRIIIFFSEYTYMNECECLQEKVV